MYFYSLTDSDICYEFSTNIGHKSFIQHSKAVRKLSEKNHKGQPGHSQLVQFVMKIPVNAKLIVSYIKNLLTKSSQESKERGITS